MDRKQIRKLERKLVKTAGNPNKYQGDGHPGIETVGITRRDAWDLIYILREFLSHKEPSILERLMDDLSFMAEVFEYIKAEKKDANYTLNFKDGKLISITKENR